MRSGGFGLGKKTQREEPKRMRPSNADLTQLLNSSQKSPDKIFSTSWAAKDSPNSQFVLTVMNVGARGDRRGWSSSAIDNSGVGEAEWKLSKETNAISSPVFSMRTSDSYLILTLIEEAEVTGGAGGPVSMPASVAPGQSSEYGMEAEENSSPRANPGSIGVQEGSLRQINIRKLLESYNADKATGRLICDIGTVQSEVFLTDGEPVHAKSSHSISQGRDTIGDKSLIDLLTWRDGTYKFQDGWPAATRTITSTLQMFLAGEVVVPDPAIAAASASSTSSGAGPTSSSADGYAPAPQPTYSAPAQAAPPPPAAPSLAPGAGFGGSADDFSRVDDLIGAIYSNLVESSGLLKYGMFLMLVRSEFVRFERAKTPFCFASIGMEMPAGAQLTEAALAKIGERFEKVCQPLDAISYAGQTRFFALFPQSEGPPTMTLLKNFMNNVTAIPLDAGLHGSAIKMTIGLSEVPRDGAEFQQVFNKASGLRSQAGPEKKIVSSAF